MVVHRLQVNDADLSASARAAKHQRDVFVASIGVAKLKKPRRNIASVFNLTEVFS
jgi:hypothetical protein